MGGGRQDIPYEAPKEHKGNEGVYDGQPTKEQSKMRNQPEYNPCRIRSPTNWIRSEEGSDLDTERHKAVTKDEDRRKKRHYIEGFTGKLMLEWLRIR